jgi:WD40 repeat protein
LRTVLLYIFLQDIHDGLDFSQHEDVQYAFGIFSVKFSSDGRELVAGSNDESIYVYDLHANKLTLRLPAHTVWQIAYFLGLHKPSIPLMPFVGYCWWKKKEC